MPRGVYVRKKKGPRGSNDKKTKKEVSLTNSDYYVSATFAEDNETLVLNMEMDEIVTTDLNTAIENASDGDLLYKLVPVGRIKKGLESIK